MQIRKLAEPAMQIPNLRLRTVRKVLRFLYTF